MPRGLFASRYFWQGVFFALIFTVAVVLSALVAPDWMWMYFWDASPKLGLSDWIYLIAFFYVAPYLAGYAVAFEVRRKSSFVWLLLLTSLIATEILLIVNSFERYSVVGTREEFLAGTAQSLFSPFNPVAKIMNSAMLLMGIYLTMVYLSYRRTRRRVLE